MNAPNHQSVCIYAYIYIYNEEMGYSSIIPRLIAVIFLLDCDHFAWISSVTEQLFPSTSILSKIVTILARIATWGPCKKNAFRPLIQIFNDHT